MKTSPRLALVLSLALLVPAAAVVGGSNWPEWRGPARTGVSTETGLPSSWSPAGREPRLESALRRPFGAGRVRRPPLPAEHRRHGRDRAGTADVLPRRHRQAAVGAPLQHLHERCAGAPHGLGVARRRSRLGQRHRDQRQRPAHGALSRRQAAVGAVARRRSRHVDDARRAHVVADHRRQSGDRQRPHVLVGPVRRRRAPFHELRQDQRPDAVDQRARGPADRHHLRQPVRRRRSTARACSSRAAATARCTR